MRGSLIWAVAVLFAGLASNDTLNSPSASMVCTAGWSKLLLADVSELAITTVHL